VSQQGDYIPAPVVVPVEPAHTYTRRLRKLEHLWATGVAGTSMLTSMLDESEFESSLAFLTGAEGALAEGG